MQESRSRIERAERIGPKPRLSGFQLKILSRSGQKISARGANPGNASSKWMALKGPESGAMNPQFLLSLCRPVRADPNTERFPGVKTLKQLR
jgi:hypothetical protein